MTRMNFILGTILLVATLFVSPAFAQDYPSSEAFVFVDEPPKPLNLGDVRAAIGYPEEAVKQNIEGTVVCRVLVDKQGNFVQHLVMGNPSSVLLEAINNKIGQLKFTPARLQGKALAYWINIPFKFRLVSQESKQYEELLETMTDSLTGMQEDYDLWFRRALVYIKLNKYKEATDDLEESIRLNPRKNKKKASKNTYPSLIKSTFAKATILDKEEDFPAAIFQYAKVISMAEEMKIQDPEVDGLVLQSHLGRGYIYLEIDSAKRAKQDLLIAIKDTGAVKCAAYELLADMGIRDSAYAELSVYYDGLIACNPDQDLLHYSRGYYASRAGEFDKALKDFEYVEEKIKVTELLQATYNQKAYCYLNLEEYDKGLASVEKSLKLNILNGDAYYFKARIQEAQGLTQKACDNYSKSLKYSSEGAYRKEAIQKMKDLCGGWEEQE